MKVKCAALFSACLGLAGALLLLPAANAETLWGDTADASARNVDSNGYGNATINVTSTLIVGSESAGNRNSAVFVFALPALAAGREVDTASFSAVLNASNVSSFNADVYALRVSSASMVLISDYGGGTDPLGPPRRVKLQDNWLTSASSPGTRCSSDAGAAAALGQFLRENYQAGWYLFIGAHCDVTNPPDAARYLLYAAGQGDTNLNPTLVIATRDGNSAPQPPEVIGETSDVTIADFDQNGFGDGFVDQGQNNINVGAYSSNDRRCGVFVFRLPALAAGQRVEAADVEIGIPWLDSGPGFSMDLWHCGSRRQTRCRCRTTGSETAPMARRARPGSTIHGTRRPGTTMHSGTAPPTPRMPRWVRS